MDPFAYHAVKLFLHGQAAERAYRVRQTVMTVDVQAALIAAFFHSGCYHTDHPDNTQDMVGMFMGDENVMDFRQRYLHILQDTENTVSAACIYHKEFTVHGPYGKTCIIAPGDGGIAGAENIEKFFLHGETSLR